MSRNRPLTEIEEKILRKHVENLGFAMQMAKYLSGQMDALEKECLEARSSKERLHLLRDLEAKTRVARQELIEHHNFLRRVAFIRREVLLHMHLDKLESLGLSYPEVPVYLEE